MNIGKKIKLLRKEKNTTQEKLAAYLNVSCQAISKWENGTTSPDISLIVPISNFFNITTDELFERNEEKQKAEIEEILKKSSEFRTKGMVKEDIELFENAVSKYPNNYECLVNYANALFHAKHSPAFTNDEETADKHTAKALEICELILEDCTENVWRDSATQILVMIYGNQSSCYFNEEKAVKYAEQAPSLYFCNELLLESAYKINSENHLEQKHNNILRFLDLLTQSITFNNYKSSEEKIFAFKTAINILNYVLYDGNLLFYHCRAAHIYQYMAKEYAKLKSETDVIESLEFAKKHALMKDKIPDGKNHFTSIFVNKAYHDNSTTSKNYPYSEIEIISKLLTDKAFDFMRESKAFVEFQESLV